MPKTEAEFNELMRDVLAGSEAAAQQLFRDYEPHLLRAIRRRLNKKMRPKFDSVDFAQDVWASFFAEDPEKRVFDSAEDLIRFLIRLASNKVADAARKQFKTQKCNIEREQSIEDPSVQKHNLMGAQPTPSQIVMSEEEWGVFLRRQPLVYRRILVLLREGRTPDSIADELKIHARTVYRVAERLAPGLKP